MYLPNLKLFTLQQQGIYIYFHLHLVLYIVITEPYNFEEVYTHKQKE